MLRLTRPTYTLNLIKPLFLHLSSILHQMRFKQHGGVHEIIRGLFWRKYGCLRGVLGSVVEFLRHCLGHLKVLLSLVRYQFGGDLLTKSVVPLVRYLLVVDVVSHLFFVLGSKNHLRSSSASVTCNRCI